MKNSKFLFFLASLNVASILSKILLSFSEGYMIPQGWLNGLILDALSVYVLVTSKVAHKEIYLLWGVLTLAVLVVLLALLASTGWVYLGW
jgi:hypothetical protein